MKTYESMKPSTVFWLGMIPEHWEERFLEQTCHEKCVKNIGNTESNVLSLSYGYIIKKKNVYSGLVAKDFSTYQIVQNGDIILRFTDLQNDHKSLRTGLVTQTGIITSAYTCIVPTINSAYLHYLLHAYDLRKVFYGMGGGVRQSIGYKDVRHMTVLVPPREEQDQIVRFLDWKVSEINRLINIKRKEIERLEELKNHTITKCITKGLDNAVQFKYSGTDWIGEIPEHWVTIQLRRAFSVILGKMLAPAPSSDSDTHEEYVCAKDVHFDGVDLTSLKKMWFSPSEKKQYEIKSGDLLIVEGGAGAGNAALVPDLNGQSIYVQNSIHIVRAKSNQALNKFLCYWIGSLVKRGYMKNICSVATIPHFTKDKVLSTVMPLAPIEEQIEIVAFLDKKCQEIDELISFKEQQIQALHEFKTRLISDVVTGKIDVRGIEIPEYEYTAEEADSDSEAEAEELDEGADEA